MLAIHLTNHGIYGVEGRKGKIEGFSLIMRKQIGNKGKVKKIK